MRIITVVTVLLPFFISYTTQGETKALTDLKGLLRDADDDDTRIQDGSQTCTCSVNSVTSVSEDGQDDPRNYDQEGQIDLSRNGQYDRFDPRMYAQERHIDPRMYAQERHSDPRSYAKMDISDPRNSGIDPGTPTEINSDGNNYVKETDIESDGGGGYDFSGSVGANSLNLKDKDTDNPKVIKQVIFIEPPDYIYKHELQIQQPKQKSPRTVIYVFPPQVKHVYNITDKRVQEKPLDPTVYYLTMNELYQKMQETGSSDLQRFQNHDDEDDEREIKLNSLEIKSSSTDENMALGEKVDDNSVLVVDQNTEFRSDGFNLIDPRLGVFQTLKSMKDHKIIKTDANSDPPDHSNRKDVSNVPESDTRTKLIEQTPTIPKHHLENKMDVIPTQPNPNEPSNPEFVQIEQILQQFQQNSQSNNPDNYIPESKSVENHNYFDSISEESRHNDFEIIPAILERHFYLGPHQHLYQR